MWRGALIVLICFLATKIPKFALVYSFVGGFGGCLLAFVFPLVFYVGMATRSSTIDVKSSHVPFFTQC